jgi:hypothetical protein
MFQEACKKNRESIYCIVGSTPISNNQQVNDTGSAFMIAPGILATVRHLVHKESNVKNPIHKEFHVFRAPEIGQPGKNFESAKFIAEYAVSDIALLEISNPQSSDCIILEPNRVAIGTSCGSYGFPLAEPIQTPQGLSWRLIERFQGSNISSFHKHDFFSENVPSDAYEIDSLMYNGSSGCPAFLTNSKVVGMQSQSFLGPSLSASAKQPISNLKSARKVKGGAPPKKAVVNDTRLAISILVPSMDIITLARDNGINI